ncbi:MAG: hypothetical protein JOZ19_01745 [Rubrobacter sp.]|nr:hypothetical protein [Rubrobacter sp.]
MSIQRERVALVTGSTSGIGREVAITLAGARPIKCVLRKLPRRERRRVGE